MRLGAFLVLDPGRNGPIRLSVRAPLHGAVGWEAVVATEALKGSCTLQAQGCWGFLARQSVGSPGSPCPDRPPFKWQLFYNLLDELLWGVSPPALQHRLALCSAVASAASAWACCDF